MSPVPLPKSSTCCGATSRSRRQPASQRTRACAKCSLDSPESDSPSSSALSYRPAYSSKAAFITGLSVVLVPVFLAAFWRKKIGAWAWVGATASFAGLYFLTVPMQGLADLNRGDVLVMGCAVLYALQIIFIERYTGKYSLGALSCLQVILAGVLSTIAVPVLNAAHWEQFFVRFTFQMEFGVIVTAIFTTALAYPLLVWGQKHTTATNTALILTAEPVFAALTSFLVLHERLGGRALAGAGLILGGICIAEWKGTIPSAGS